MALDLDPRFTFETFIVGSANRLATAAARRVAESPGTTYNPLFIYSASGLGKTHLVTALGHHAERLHPEMSIIYDTLERFMEEVMTGIEAGDRDAFRGRVQGRGILILDDVQFLAGRHRTQEELLRTWDATSGYGGQIVLASDRPPHEIDAIDERLLSRFSGGLLVDIGAPDYETRLAILRRKAEAQGQTLASDVAEALARLAFSNVRELQGALNRVLALQELEGRPVRSTEVARAIGRESQATPGRGGDEFGAFLADISETLEQVVIHSPADHQVADAILRWESEGFRTRRLESVLAESPPLDETEELVRAFEADVERLREMTLEMSAMEPDAPELRRTELLRDPDRVADAEALLAEVRERNLPLPGPGEGPPLERLGLPQHLLAVRAAQAVSQNPGQRYNPLFVHGPSEAPKREFLASLARRVQELHPDLVLACLDARRFAADFVHALEHNRVDSWRRRYQRCRVLVMDGVDHLADTERAQSELFLLFDALQRSGAQLVFAADTPPHELPRIEERLRTRFASGLVVDLPGAVNGAVATAAEPSQR
ncbi:MAG: DnaA ATPase domain-containing protein, partial [Longimicrobiales bacterium]